LLPSSNPTGSGTEDESDGDLDDSLEKA
jgi:hypothetical protein